MWNEIAFVHTQHVFTIECERMNDERTYIHISTKKRVASGIQKYICVSTSKELIHKSEKLVHMFVPRVQWSLKKFFYVVLSPRFLCRSTTI